MKKPAIRSIRIDETPLQTARGLPAICQSLAGFTPW
jgi:hypothetical protein